MSSFEETNGSYGIDSKKKH